MRHRFDKLTKSAFRTVDDEVKTLAEFIKKVEMFKSIVPADVYDECVKGKIKDEFEDLVSDIFCEVEWKFNKAQSDGKDIDEKNGAQRGIAPPRPSPLTAPERNEDALKEEIMNKLGFMKQTDDEIKTPPPP